MSERCAVQACGGNDQPLVRCGMPITDPREDLDLVMHLCTDHFPTWAAWSSVIRDPRLEREKR